MRPYPPTPDVEDADGTLLDGGHLWIREWIDGDPFRFQLRESGVVRFGGATGTFGEDVPDRYRHAVRHVRERLDREALAAAVDDVGRVTFFAVATGRRTIEYDWERLPSVLGVEVWADDGFLQPDAVERVYERLGLEAVNAFEKETSPRDFDPSTDSIPASNWYDGPAAGIEIRNTRGSRGKVLHPAFTQEPEPTPEPLELSAHEAVGNYATEERIDRIAGRLEDRGVPLTVETLYEHLLDDVLRVHHRRLSHPKSTVDARDFRSELASVASEYLSDHGRRQDE